MLLLLVHRKPYIFSSTVYGLNVKGLNKKKRKKHMAAVIFFRVAEF